ncbi:MAG TPA: glycosyltransferase, partial [Roseococcus sp.]|nr:glycosyltransferase [Roseococcus sp.]
RFLTRQMRRARRVLEWTREGRLLPELHARRGFVTARLSWLREWMLLRAGLRVDLRARLGLPASQPAPEARTILLPTSDRPEVSVVIPAYGQVDHSLRCLASLAAHPPGLPFEVILAEDASGDPRAAELREVRGLRLIERAHNLGFLRSANYAMSEARGRFLLLLNNDTEVMPGAVDALVDTLTADHPGFPGPVGLAGARLLYPEGWLQEAGGILWRDGSAWNWGNRQDPRLPPYRYLREADYVSGAAIMLPRAAWEAMGGFDAHFLPAYYEDTDLALRLRAAGWRTLFQPRATVIHHEGASHGTDTSQGVKAHQVTNQAKFLARWTPTLAAHQPNGENLIRARDRAPLGPDGRPGPRRVVLVADNNMPEPDRDAGSRNILAWMEALLRQGHAVKFWPLNGFATPGYTEALEAIGIECLTRPAVAPWPAWLEQNGAQLDEVILARPHVATDLLPALREHAPKAARLYYGHDLHHARLLREAAHARDMGDAPRAARLDSDAVAMREEEMRAWAGCHVALYPSEEEAEEVRRLAPGTPSAAVTPFVLEPRAVPTPGPSGRAELVFVAGFAHRPNVDAALWLVRDILPLLHRSHPGLRLSLVGSYPTAEVQALAGPLVEVTGFVSAEELERRYGAARLAICPLRFGAGIKLKVVEAMHAGLPLITTPVGIQGLDGAPCPSGATAEAIAALARPLLEDDGAWARVAEAQQCWVYRRFSPGRIQDELEAAFTSAAARA